MIKVNIFKNQDIVSGIEIKGHANSGEYGKDLVCAGVSAISIGMNNALDAKGIECNVEVESGYFRLMLNEESDVAQIILFTAIVQLETIQESYSKYIRIGNKEV